MQSHNGILSCFIMYTIYPRKRLPVLSRQKIYQVAPLYTCRPHKNVLFNCFQNVSINELKRCSWFKHPNQEPSRDTCFLCMKKVIWLEMECCSEFPLPWFNDSNIFHSMSVFIKIFQVPEEDWEGHRLECAITNKVKYKQDNF